MSDIEQDPKADLSHQSDMPTTEEENVNIVSNENFDGLIKLSVAKSCDCLRETASNCDGLTIPALLEKSDGLTEPSDVTIDDEIEAGEISSPKGSEEEEKTFAVECELDFEDEAERDSAEISTKKVKTKEESGDGEDDGECTDEVDEDVEELEEGELKDEIPGPLETNATSKPNPPTKTVCRFYNRGVCFYGNNCRFLHVNFLKTGNYSMFAPAHKGFADGYDPAPPVGNMTHGMVNHRSGVPPPRTDFPPVPSLCPSVPPAEPAALESAWVRALTEAKELVKKANKRKVEEPDFEEKRLNLSLVVNEKNIPEVENEIPYKKKKRENSAFLKREFDESHDIYNDGYEPRPHWREGHFDNMEIRYEKELRRGRGRMDRERDKFPKSPDQNKERFRDDRLQQVQSRSRVDDYFDPWRRSKSPKGNVRRTRSRSGSYSSVSSYSYSSRSSRSSCSYSRSSSSSRSPHPHQKRTPSPPIVNPPFASPKIGPNKFTTMKNKPGGRPSSRSMSRTPSRSRSRSFSRSISMDSVSSASSSISRSSHSEPGHQSSHASILRKHENPSTAVGEKSDPVITATSNPPAIPLPTVYLNYNPPNRDICKVEKTKETPKQEPPIIDEDERDPLEEKFLTPVCVDVPFPSLQHLLPTNDKAKEPFKGTPHKQQIKLTLLNKTPKLNNLPKKELDVNRKNDEPSKPVGFYLGVKGPLSPPVPPVSTKPAPVLVPKKSASSRRDELLKQLKAVEDAIARKRAKFG